jgi:hypothetical protein
MSNNPLRQYFRRPAIYLKLPSKGVGYSVGSLELSESNELPVFPMTAIDEITSKTPDALYNGSAVVDIIKSCIPGIKNPWEVKSTDIDAIFVAIRIASSGGIMEIESECPACNETSKFDLNLSHLLANFKAGDYSKLVTVGELSFKLQPLTYKDSNNHNISQFELRKQFSQFNFETMTEENQAKLNSDLLKRINDQTMTLMTDCIEYIKVEDQIVSDKVHIEDFLRNCDRRTFEVLRELNVSLRQESETKPLDIKCMHCSHEFQQEFVLNVSDFFDFGS